MRILIIDNYDSFTFNIVHYFFELGVDVNILRNNLNIKNIENGYFTHLVISPGPCTPNKAGFSIEVIKHFANKIPILGICLGHQIIGQVFGCKMRKSTQLFHGKTSRIKHINKGLFKGFKTPILINRYHSLIIDRKYLPDNLEVTAQTDCYDITPNVIMGIKHKQYNIEGLQFHPESILSFKSHGLLKNFIKK
ncbi:anthranilate synthase component II [Candidatus Portiera aleyrodidarum]|uniref:Anthranilate synthase n=1 Tax=Candidatus Portiera aleyrodidarum MED (Bemisia tabaci) TaxID=1163752 RepID=A0AAU8RPA5_9GAMM|nr:aminodeoxychorismate/anthranilate synthase component II [Candidatus Portiera aleyrodidarum]AFS18951.1 Anthranilate synthase component 2 [Candidatus Portiera aleyrodidarum BT-QVLC]AFT80605.1 Anthranilate synthase amidotransferase component [Candidatus Portiera aleyrodidarum BT-QVLC]AJF24172.1 anthranilate synthase [Candidatus Portiera aleyrodidarum MED (Bemisia tabaci)]